MSPRTKASRGTPRECGREAGAVLTAPGGPRDKQGVTPRSSWHLGLLVSGDPGRRNRRPIDVVLFASAALVAAFAAVIAKSASNEDESVARALVAVLGWASSLWHAALLAAILLALAIVADALRCRRWDLARDLLVASSVLAVTTGVLGRVVEADWLPIEADLWSRWGFPEPRLAFVVAMVTVAGPELVRPARVLTTWLVPTAAVGAVALEAVSPAGALGGVAVGVAVGALVRVTFGSAAGMPSLERVTTALAALGVEIGDLSFAPRQRVGAAEFVGHDANGRPLKVRVLGRDAQDTQRLARRWRLLAYRDPPRSAPIGRLEQVEHEALAILAAAQAGVRVPEVATVGLGPDGRRARGDAPTGCRAARAVQRRSGDRRDARGALPSG